MQQKGWPSPQSIELVEVVLATVITAAITRALERRRETTEIVKIRAIISMYIEV